MRGIFHHYGAVRFTAAAASLAAIAIAIVHKHVNDIMLRTSPHQCAGVPHTGVRRVRWCARASTSSTASCAAIGKRARQTRCSCVHPVRHADTHIHMHEQTQGRTRTHTHTHANTRSHTHTHKHARTLIRKNTLTYIHYNLPNIAVLRRRPRLRQLRRQQNDATDGHTPTNKSATLQCALLIVHSLTHIHSTHSPHQLAHR